MAKLSKQQANMHSEACEILQQDHLSYDEKVFVLEHWNESASHMNGVVGAFFTPLSLARELAIETPTTQVRRSFGGIRPRRIVDLCAGIGALAFAVNYSGGDDVEITCVEINPDYVEVGKKILPNAKWIRQDVMDYRPAPGLLDPDGAKPFDCAISNPPFGRIKGSAESRAPRYSGSDFEYKMIDVAESIASEGVFILPQSSLPWAYSGVRSFERKPNAKFDKFHQQTGISLTMNCGIDTTCCSVDWKFPVSPVEIALGFTEEQ